nr:hypothetical protein [Tanacetum cinerariifolium]
DDDDDEEEISKISEQEATESDEGDDDATESDGESEDEKTREQEDESFDPIPRTPEDSKDDGNNEEDQGLRISEEEKMHEEEEANELYQDVLVEAYDADKTILDTYGESVILKRRREEDDDQEGPFAGSDRGSNRRKEEREHASANTLSEPATGSAGRSNTGTQSRQLSASESAFAEEPVQTTCQMEEPSHRVFETSAEDKPLVHTFQHPEWFSQPRRPPTPDCDWNKSLPAAQGNAQSWISALARQTDARSSFNELLDTPIDFSNFIMNRLGVDTLTPELLAGPTYELIRGVLDVPSNDSKEELSWNSSDDEDVDEQTKGRDETEGEKTDESDDDHEEAEVNDDDNDEEEVPKIDEQETTESGEGDDEATESDRESEDEETRE